VAVEVVMPKLGMAMKEGTVSVWNKGVGDSVGKGEPIACINSEKIEMDLEAPADGTLLKINVPEGQGVPPGTVICHIGVPGERIEEAAPALQENHAESAEAGKALSAVKVSTPATRNSKDRIKISPVARKMAEAANLDLDQIEGSGPGGRITKEDIQLAIKKKQSAKNQDEPKQASTEQQQASNAPKAGKVELARQIPVTGMRKVISDRMQSSLQTTAQLTINMKVDVTDLIALQKQYSEGVQKKTVHKLTVTSFIAKASVLALQEHEQMNSALVDDKIHLYSHINLGMAVALEKGLVVPVIRHAEALSITELSANIKTLSGKAREGQLMTEDMQGSTFTITNLGALGVEHFTPILNPPEAGILGVGAVHDTPVYIGEEIKRRSILPLSLTFDHRVLDGAPAAAFLKTIKKYLETPITMLI
jgi:pyruvate dehydrogenase E2 component (dihydrolipoamide acetyltransferase)